MTWAPNPYQAEAMLWASRQPPGTEARRLADDARAFEATYDETRAEAGRYGDQCPFTQERLAMISRDIRAAYRDANLLWARGYSRRDNT
jgi:hypothetical protein